MKQMKFAFGLAVVLIAVACRPTPGPDKSAVGAVLGAGWGAGAGAVIGNQTGHPGSGAAIGAGFGAVSGLLTGVGLDIAEGNELRMQRELDALKVQVAANQRSIASLQHGFDQRNRRLKQSGGDYVIFFDEDRAALRSGSLVQLERLANFLKLNPYVGAIEVHGHSDDTGETERNKRLSEARARSVLTYLASSGLSMDKMSILAHGSEQPLATNETDVGRQLNRRVEVVVGR